MIEKNKPLGIKNYGHIPHLSGSRVTPADKHCHEGQARIATEKPRDRHDIVYVTEKLDGSNVGVARVGNDIIAIQRSGYLAETSPYEQHHLFAKWVEQNKSRFLYILQDGERVVGEWLAQAHGTRYQLRHEPFVIFDLMIDHEHMPYELMVKRIQNGNFTTPFLVHKGLPIGINAALDRLGKHGQHGAIDEAEGVVWRVERRGKFDFMVKYVKPYKIDGVYLPEISGKELVWNWR